MADWVYVAHKLFIDGHITFTDRAGSARPVRDERTFANAIEELHPEFGLVRQIANSAKHLHVSHGKHSVNPITALDVASKSTNWGVAEWDKDPWNGKGVVFAPPGGSEHEVSKLAKATYETWINICRRYGWPLT
jgi:hypothetical protein